MQTELSCFEKLSKVFYKFEAYLNTSSDLISMIAGLFFMRLSMKKVAYVFVTSPLILKFRFHQSQTSFW